MLRRFHLVCFLTFLLVAIGFSEKRVPIARNSAPVTSQPQASVRKSTPYPTPRVDLRPFLHEQGGKVITVANSNDLGAAINQAERVLGARPGKIVVRGGGPIRTQAVVSHDLSFERGVYSCETKTSSQGCILLKDNVKAEALGQVTILEPTYFEPNAPAITVFQAYAAAQKNEDASRKITVKGFRIQGRQKYTDGGVRQSISFGNCDTCAALDNTLEGIASIGIQNKSATQGSSTYGGAT